MLRRPEIRIADRRGVEVIIGYLRLVSRKSGRVIHTRQIIFRGNTGIIPDILGHGQPCEDISPDHNVRLVNVINRIVRHLDLKPGRLECLRPVPAVDQVVLQRRFGIEDIILQTDRLLRIGSFRFGRIERLVGDGHLHNRIPEIDTLEILRIVRIVNHIVGSIHGTILDMQRRIIGGIGRRKEVVIARSRDMQVLESRIVLATQFRPGDRRLRTFGITADQHDVAHIDRRARNRERQIGSIGVVDENQTSGRNDRSGQFGGLEQLRFRIDRLIDRQVAQRNVFPVLIILVVVRLGGNGSLRRRVPDACHLARQIAGIGDHVDRIGRIGFEIPDRHARTRTGRAFGKDPGGVGSRFRRFEAEVFPAVGIGRGRNVEGQRRLRGFDRRGVGHRNRRSGGSRSGALNLDFGHRRKPAGRKGLDRHVLRRVGRGAGHGCGGRHDQFGPLIHGIGQACRPALGSRQFHLLDPSDLHHETFGGPGVERLHALGRRDDPAEEIAHDRNAQFLAAEQPDIEVAAVDLHLLEELVGHRTRADGLDGLALGVLHIFEGGAAVVAHLPVAGGLVDAEPGRRAVLGHGLHAERGERGSVVGRHLPLALVVDRDDRNHSLGLAALHQFDSLAVGQRDDVFAIGGLDLGDRGAAVEFLQRLDVAVQRVDLRFERLHAALQVVDRIPQVVVVVARLENRSQRDEDQDQILFHNMFGFLFYFNELSHAGTYPNRWRSCAS